MRCLAVIPARGGSKGVPRKNLRLLAGVPLIALSIAFARSCKCIARVVVTTDDEEIAAVARRSGAEVPGLRPPELAGDDVPLLPVVQEAVRRADPKGEYPAVLLLQPTTPLRIEPDVQSALHELQQHPDCDAVLSLTPVRQHPFRMRLLEDGVPVPLFKTPEGTAQRQDLPEVYYFSGAIVAARREALLRQRTFWGENLRAVVVDDFSGIDIDDEMDFLHVEAAMHWLTGPR